MDSILRKGALPVGYWITFYGVDPATTPEEFRELLEARTGLHLEADRVIVDPTGKLVASFEKQHMRVLLMWALQDDLLRGRKLDCTFRNT